MIYCIPKPLPFRQTPQTFISYRQINIFPPFNIVEPSWYLLHHWIIVGWERTTETVGRRKLCVKYLNIKSNVLQWRDVQHSSSINHQTISAWASMSLHIWPPRVFFQELRNGSQQVWWHESLNELLLGNFILSVIISNHCDLPNEMFKRVHWEGKSKIKTNKKSPTELSLKSYIWPAWIKVWKGPGINMGIELFVVFELYWRKWYLTPLSIYQAICQYRKSRFKLLALLTKHSVY